MYRVLIILSLIFLYSLPTYSKILLISDIDDTIKKANSMGKIAGAYHFLRKVPYLEMRDLFTEIAHQYTTGNDEGISFYYVSAAPDFLFNADRWLYKNNFPYGKSYLKKGKQSTYDFKYNTIKTIIEKEMSLDPNIKVMFFGDNAKVDQVVYNDLRTSLNLDAQIFIRDVRAEATYFAADLPVVRLPNTIYYFSEIELFSNFNFLTTDLLEQVRKKYLNKKLIPKYTLETLEDRLTEICKNTFSACRNKSRDRSEDLWNDYYSRF